MAATPKKTATAVAAESVGAILTLTFAHGMVLTVHADDLSPAIRDAAVMHGLKQKLIDAAAIARNPDTGATATIADKYAAVREVYDRITATDGTATWNKVRGGEGTGNAKGGLLVAAIVRITGKTRDAVLEYVDALSKEQVAALRKNPRVAEMIATIQSERAKTEGVDSDALLNGLIMGDDGDAGDAGEDEEASL